MACLYVDPKTGKEFKNKEDLLDYLNNNEDNKILFTSLDKVNSVLSKNNIYINEKDVPLFIDSFPTEIENFVSKTLKDNKIPDSYSYHFSNNIKELPLLLPLMHVDDSEEEPNSSLPYIALYLAKNNNDITIQDNNILIPTKYGNLTIDIKNNKTFIENTNPIDNILDVISTLSLLNQNIEKDLLREQALNKNIDSDKINYSIHSTYSKPFINNLKISDVNLYNSLLLEISKNKEITNEIVNKYIFDKNVNISNEVIETELIFNALRHEYEKRLNIKKDKTLIKNIKSYWKSFTSFYKDLFIENNTFVEEIKPTSTIKEIIEYNAFGKNNIKLMYSEKEIKNLIKNINTINNNLEQAEKLFSYYLSNKIGLNTIFSNLNIKNSENIKTWILQNNPKSIIDVISGITKDIYYSINDDNSTKWSTNSKLVTSSISDILFAYTYDIDIANNSIFVKEITKLSSISNDLIEDNTIIEFILNNNNPSEIINKDVFIEELIDNLSKTGKLTINKLDSTIPIYTYTYNDIIYERNEFLKKIQEEIPKYIKSTLINTIFIAENILNKNTYELLVTKYKAKTNNNGYLSIDYKNIKNDKIIEQKEGNFEQSILVNNLPLVERLSDGNYVVSSKYKPTTALLDTNNINPEVINELSLKGINFATSNNNKNTISTLKELKAIYSTNKNEEKDSLIKKEKENDIITDENKETKTNEIYPFDENLEKSFYPLLIELYNEKAAILNIEQLNDDYSRKNMDTIHSVLTPIDIYSYYLASGNTDFYVSYLSYLHDIRKNYVNINSEYYKYLYELTNNDEITNKLYKLTKTKEFETVYGNIDNNIDVDVFFQLANDSYTKRLLDTIIENKPDLLLAGEFGYKLYNPEKYAELNINLNTVEIIADDVNKVLAYFNNPILTANYKNEKFDIYEYIVSDKVIASWDITNIEELNPQEYSIVKIYYPLNNNYTLQDTLTKKDNVQRLVTGEPLLTVEEIMSFENAKKNTQPKPVNKAQKDKKKSANNNKQKSNNPETHNNEIIEKLKDKFKKRFNTNVVVIENENIIDSHVVQLDINNPEYFSYIQKGLAKEGDIIIVVNPNKLTNEITIHEFGHILLDIVGVNSDIVLEGIAQLKNTILYKTVEETYKEKYKDKEDSESLIGLEALNTAIGVEGEKIFNNTNSTNNFKNWLYRFYYYLANKLRTLLRNINNVINIPVAFTPDLSKMLAYDLISAKTNKKYTPTSYLTENNLYYISDKDRKAIEDYLKIEPLTTDPQKESITKLLENTKDLSDIKVLIENANNNVDLINSYATFFKINTNGKTTDELKAEITKVGNKFYAKVNERTKEIEKLYLRTTSLFEEIKETKTESYLAEIFADSGTVNHNIFEYIAKLIDKKRIEDIEKDDKSSFVSVEKHKDDIKKEVFDKYQAFFYKYFSASDSNNTYAFDVLFESFFNLIYTIRVNGGFILTETQVKIDTINDVFKNTDGFEITGVSGTIDATVILPDGSNIVLDIKNTSSQPYHEEALFNTKVEFLQGINVVPIKSNAELFGKFVSKFKDEASYTKLGKKYLNIAETYRNSIKKLSLGSRESHLSKLRQHFLQVSIYKKMVEYSTNKPTIHFGQVYNQIVNRVSFNEIIQKLSSTIKDFTKIFLDIDLNTFKVSTETELISLIQLILDNHIDKLVDHYINDDEKKIKEKLADLYTNNSINEDAYTFLSLFYKLLNKNIIKIISKNVSSGSHTLTKDNIKTFILNNKEIFTKETIVEFGLLYFREHSLYNAYSDTRTRLLPLVLYSKPDTEFLNALIPSDGTSFSYVNSSDLSGRDYSIVNPLKNQLATLVSVSLSNNEEYKELSDAVKENNLDTLQKALTSFTNIRTFLEKPQRVVYNKDKIKQLDDMIAFLNDKISNNIVLDNEEIVFSALSSFVIKNLTIFKKKLGNISNINLQEKEERDISNIAGELLHIGNFLSSLKWIFEINKDDYEGTKLEAIILNLKNKESIVNQLTLTWQDLSKKALEAVLIRYTMEPNLIQKATTFFDNSYTDLSFLSSWLDTLLYTDISVIATTLKNIDIAQSKKEQLSKELTTQFHIVLENYLKNTNNTNIDHLFQRENKEVNGNTIQIKTGQFLREYNNYVYEELITLYNVKLAYSDAGNNEKEEETQKLIDNLLKEKFLLPFVKQFYDDYESFLSIIDQEADIDINKLPDYFNILKDENGIYTDESIEIIKNLKEKARVELQKLNMQKNTLLRNATLDRMNMTKEEYKQLQDIKNKEKILSSLTNEYGNDKEGEELIIANIIKHFYDESKLFHSKYYETHISEQYKILKEAMELEYNSIINNSESTKEQIDYAIEKRKTWIMRNEDVKYTDEYKTMLYKALSIMQNTAMDKSKFELITELRKKLRDKLKLYKLEYINIDDLLRFKDLIKNKNENSSIPILKAFQDSNENFIYIQEYYNNMDIDRIDEMRNYNSYIKDRNTIVKKINNILSKKAYLKGTNDSGIFFDSSKLSIDDLNDLTNLINTLKALDTPILERTNYIKENSTNEITMTGSNAFSAALEEVNKKDNDYIKKWKELFTTDTISSNFWNLYNNLKKELGFSKNEYSEEIEELIRPYRKKYGDEFNPLTDLPDLIKEKIKKIKEKLEETRPILIIKAIDGSEGKTESTIGKVVFTEEYLESIRTKEIMDTAEINKVKNKINALLSTFVDKDNGLYIDLEETPLPLPVLIELKQLLSELKRLTPSKNAEVYQILEETTDRTVNNLKYTGDLSKALTYMITYLPPANQSTNVYDYIHNWFSIFSNDVTDKEWSKKLTDLFKEITINLDENEPIEIAYLEKIASIKTNNNKIDINLFFDKFMNGEAEEIMDTIYARQEEKERKSHAQMTLETENMNEEEKKEYFKKRKQIFKKIDEISTNIYTREFIYFLIKNDILKYFVTIPKTMTYVDLLKMPIDDLISEINKNNIYFNTKFEGKETNTFYQLMEQIKNKDEHLYKFLNMITYVDNFRDHENNIITTVQFEPILCNMLIPRNSELAWTQGSSTFYGTFDAIKTEDHTYTDIVDEKKTQLLDVLNKLISFDTISAYTELIEAAKNEATSKDISIYETDLWKDNHIYNYFLQSWQPLSIWTKLKIDSKYIQKNAPNPMFFGTFKINEDLIDQDKTNAVRELEQSTIAIYTDAYKQAVADILKINISAVPNNILELSQDNLNKLKAYEIYYDGKAYNWYDLFHYFNVYTNREEPLDIFINRTPYDPNYEKGFPKSHFYYKVIKEEAKDPNFKFQKGTYSITLEKIKDIIKQNITPKQLQEFENIVFTEFSTKKDDQPNTRHNLEFQVRNYLETTLMSIIPDSGELLRIIDLFIIKFFTEERDNYVFKVNTKNFAIVLEEELLNFFISSTTTDIDRSSSFSKDAFKTYLRSKLLKEPLKFNYSSKEIVNWNYSNITNILPNLQNVTKEDYEKIENRLLYIFYNNDGLALPKDEERNEEFVKQYGTPESRTPVQQANFEFYTYLENLMSYLVEHLNTNNVVANEGLPAYKIDPHTLEQKGLKEKFTNLFSVDSDSVFANIFPVSETNSTGAFFELFNVFEDYPESLVRTFIENSQTYSLHLGHIEKLNQLAFFKPINKAIKELSKEFFNSEMRYSEAKKVLETKFVTLNHIKKTLKSLKLEDPVTQSLVAKVEELLPQIYKSNSSTEEINEEKLIEVLLNILRRPAGFYDYVNFNKKQLKDAIERGDNEAILRFYEKARSFDGSDRFLKNNLSFNVPYKLDEHVIVEIEAMENLTNLIDKTKIEQLHKEIITIENILENNTALEKADKDKLINELVDKKKKYERMVSENTVVMEKYIEINPSIKTLNDIIHSRSLGFDYFSKIMDSFIRLALEHKAKSEVENLLLLLTNVLEKNGMTFNESTNPLYNILGQQQGTVPSSSSKALEVLKKSYLPKFYNAYEHRTAFHNSLGMLMNFTSLVNLGLNVLSGINNKVYGEIQLRIEAAASEFFGKEDYLDADDLYFHGIVSEKKEYDSYTEEISEALKNSSVKGVAKAGLKLAKNRSLNLLREGKSNIPMYLGALLGGTYILPFVPGVGLVIGLFGGLLVGMYGLPLLSKIFKLSRVYANKREELDHKVEILRRKKSNGNLVNYLLEIDSDKKITLSSAIIHKFNIMQSQDELVGNKEGTINSKMHNLLLAKNAAYFLLHSGEHCLQNKALFAMMFRYKVDENGLIYKDFNQYLERNNKDIYNLSEDELTNSLDKFNSFDRLIDIYELDKENGILKVKDGKTENDTEIAAFRLQVKALNHYIHGIYNKEEAGRIKDSILGKLLLQHKNWVTANWNRRFGTRFLQPSYNQALNINQEGYFVTGTRVMFNLLASPFRNLTSERIDTENKSKYFKAMNKILAGRNSIMTNMFKYWSTLSTHEKANFKRMQKDLEYIVIWMSILGMVVVPFLKRRGDDDDDWKENPLLTVLFYETSRLRSEFITFYPVLAPYYPDFVTSGWLNEMKKFTKSPAAVLGPMQNVIGLSRGLLYHATGSELAYYKGGINNGESKAKIYAERLFPFATQIQRLANLNKQNNYYKLF